GSAAGTASATVGSSGDVKIEIRLPSPRWVDVSVLDAATGAPIARASVTVSVKKEKQASVVTDGFSMPTFEFDHGDSNAFTTDSSGHVRAGPLPVGALVVSASAEEYAAPEEPQPVEGSEARDDGLAGDCPADGEATVTVSGAKGADGTPLPLGSAGLTGVKAGQEAVVRLPPERTISGRVVGPDGKPVAQATVRAVETSDRPDEQV